MTIRRSAHNGLAPSGSSTTSAMNQRKNDSVIGGTSPTAARPATELPAQHAEAKTSIATASQRGMASERGVGVGGSVTGASARTNEAGSNCANSSRFGDDDRPFLGQLCDLALVVAEPAHDLRGVLAEHRSATAHRRRRGGELDG